MAPVESEDGITLATYASAAPAGMSSSLHPTILSSSSISPTSTSDAVLPSPTVAHASDDPNGSLLNQHQNGTPEPERGAAGANILGPQNIPLERESPDFLAPPTTDSGSVGNVKWPFAPSHNRVQDGGRARQQNDGSCRVNAVDQLGRNYLAGVYPGDLWYFPRGIPHSIEGLNDTADECEFLLVLDDGTFSEDSTFLLTDWMAHVPKEVLAKNFRVNASAFDHTPGSQLWMLPSAVPTQSVAEANPVSPAGTVPLPFTFAASKALATNTTGGTVKVIDSRTFNISQTIAVAEVTVVPGSIHELHVAPDSTRMDLLPVGYVPPTFGHYVENTGNTTLKYLEIFNSSTGNTTLKYLEIFNSNIYEDISLNQWLALTPPGMVKASAKVHLQLSDETISRLQKVKPIVVGPSEW
ncbi:hypothetical protein FRC11_011434 [Ceratobasidium sp. 423]|nr:hypothetical protein FRC11_011434 [Ceratobasidium sp. 423]